ncbi:hypothetical protein Tco_1379524, partial [Tanacetum coccineum]
MNESLTAELERYKAEVNFFEKEKEINATTREKDLKTHIQTHIFNHNDKMDAFKKELFNLKHELSLKVEASSFFKNKLETLKQESTEREDLYLDEILALKKKEKEYENI